MNNDAVKTVLEVVRGKVFPKDCALKPGDLVLDQKNNEYGIVLGIKPDDIYGKGSLKQILKDSITTKRQVIQYVKDNLDTSPNRGTYLLLTMQKADGDNYTFRIRYTNYRFIEKIPENDIFEAPESLTDLERHCTEQCIMDCYSECSLWKYRKTKP